MQFAGTDMAVEDARSAEPLEHLAEVPHVRRQSGRGYRRIFDHTRRFGVTSHAVQDTQTRLAQVPHFAHIVAIDTRTERHKACLQQGFLHRFDLSV